MNVLFVSIGDKSYYSAGIKPFVDLSYGLRKVGVNSENIIITTNPEVREFITNRFPELPVTYCASVEESLNFLVRNRPEIIVTDDFIEHIKFGLTAKKRYSAKLVVFVQLLHGFNILGRIRQTTIPASFASLLPFRAVIAGYSKLLKGADATIANSGLTHFILQNIYGIAADSIIYPPVGVTLGKIAETKSKDGLLVYLGHGLDYYSRNMATELQEVKKRLELNVSCICSKRENALAKQGFRIFTQLTDQELSELYGASSALYSPTIFETFGYTGPEALLFKTPVLLDTYQPWLECFPRGTGAIHVLRPRQRVWQGYLELIENQRDMDSARQTILEQYSVESASSHFLHLLSELTPCVNK